LSAERKRKRVDSDSEGDAGEKGREAVSLNFSVVKKKKRGGKEEASHSYKERISASQKREAERGKGGLAGSSARLQGRKRGGSYAAGKKGWVGKKKRMEGVLASFWGRGGRDVGSGLCSLEERGERRKTLPQKGGCLGRRGESSSLIAFSSEGGKGELRPRAEKATPRGGREEVTPADVPKTGGKGILFLSAKGGKWQRLNSAR